MSGNLPPQAPPNAPAPPALPPGGATFMAAFNRMLSHNNAPPPTASLASWQDIDSVDVQSVADSAASLQQAQRYAAPPPFLQQPYLVGQPNPMARAPPMVWGSMRSEMRSGVLLKAKVAATLSGLRPDVRHLLIDRLHDEPTFACLFAYDQASGAASVSAAQKTYATAEHDELLARLADGLDAQAAAAAAAAAAAQGAAAAAAAVANGVAAMDLDLDDKEVTAGGAMSTEPEQSMAKAESQPAAAARGPALEAAVVPEFNAYGLGAGVARVVVSLKATGDVQKQGNVALTSVLDVSGSMAGNRMELLKETSHFLVQQVTSSDFCGFVSYSDAVSVDVPLMRMTPNAKLFAHTVLESLTSGGSTALFAGAVAGMQQQLEPIADDAKLAKGLFLCTDGEANVGPQDSDEILPGLHKEQEARGQKCSIHTFGIGDGHCAKLLQAISESMSGTYYYIQSQTDIAPAYGDALGGLLSMVAKNVRVSIVLPGAAPAPAAALLLKLDAGGAVSGHTVTYNDIYAEEAREMLLTFQLPAGGQAGGELQLGEVVVEYTDPVTGGEVVQRLPMRVGRAAEPVMDAHPLVVTTAARYNTVQVIQEAASLNSAGKLQDATALLRKHAEHAAKLSVQCNASAPSEAKQLNMMSAQAATVARVMEDAERHARDAVQRELAVTTVTSAWHGLSQQRTAAVGATSMLPQAQANFSDNRWRSKTRESASASINRSAPRP